LADERAGHGETRAEKTERERRISELEDELHQLKEAQSGPRKPRAASPKAAPVLKSWLTGEGWGEDE
jgi:50S ribosomal subunit-associated GTPase HflX